MIRASVSLAGLLYLPGIASAAVPLPQLGWAPVEVTSAPPPEVPVQRPTEAPPPVTSTPPPVETAPPPSEPALPPEPSAPVEAEPPPVEAAPVEAAPVEAAPAPVEVAPVEAAPVEPAEGLEPAEDFEPVRYRPSSPPPLAGAGMRVGGGILVGAGGLTVLSGLALLAISESLGGDSTSRGISAAIVVVGAAEIGGGVALIVPGMRRAQALREWEAEHSIDAPSAGYGMIVGGSVLLGAGGINMITVVVASAVDGQVPVGNLLLGLGELGAGAALLTIGTKRRKAYRDWEKRTFGPPSLSLLPGGGMTVGVSGRF
ncbi:hypothetical protein [Paraliomyxa miuraensis]|uniref:hypothetical protein n=1 Tax=Paraliomyxa miuraensis TaxID=376150 RepID=UPI00224F6948|nr:hypothetical protein [Paraliomyxa miuraensis]MCX4242688.1 hypothetical protein [Paraliomyxa miuraensis]